MNQSIVRWPLRGWVGVLLLLSVLAGPINAQNRLIPRPQGNHGTFTAQLAKDVLNLNRFNKDWTVPANRPLIAAWLMPYTNNDAFNAKLFSNAGYTHLERGELIERMNVPYAKRYRMLTDANLMQMAPAYAATLPSDAPARAALQQYGANRKVLPGFYSTWRALGKWIYLQYYQGATGYDLLGWDIETFTDTPTDVAHEFAQAVNLGTLDAIDEKGHATKIFQYGSSLADVVNYNTNADNQDKHLRFPGPDWIGSDNRFSIDANPLATRYRSRVSYLGRDAYTRATADDRSFFEKNPDGSLKLDGDGNPIWVRNQKGTTTVSNYGFTDFVYTNEFREAVQEMYAEYEKIYTDFRWLCNTPIDYDGNDVPGNIPYPKGHSDIRPGMENIRLSHFYRDDTEQLDMWNPYTGQMESFGDYSNRRKQYRRFLIGKMLARTVFYDGGITWSDKGRADYIPGRPYVQHGETLPRLALGQFEDMIWAAQRGRNFPDLFTYQRARQIDFIIPKKFIRKRNAVVGEREVDKPILAFQKRTNGREIFGIWSYPVQDVGNAAHDTYIDMWVVLDDGKTSGSYRLLCKNRDTGYDAWKLPVGFEGAKPKNFRFQFKDLLGVTRTWTGDLNVPFTGSNPTPPPPIGANGSGSTYAPGTGTNPAPQTPDAPTNLAVAGVSASGGTVSWNPASGATAYDVGVTQAGGSEAIAATPNTNYALLGYQGGTTLTVRVRAKNAAGSSAWSSALTFTTTAPAPVAVNVCTEAESAGSGQSDPNASGGQFAGLGNASESRTFSYSLSSAGSYSLIVHYASAEGATIGVQLNGGGVASYNLPSTGGPSTYGSFTTTISPASPTGSLKIQGGSGYVRLDKFCFTNGGGSQAPPSTTTVSGGGDAGDAFVKHPTTLRMMGPQPFLYDRDPQTGGVNSTHRKILEALAAEGANAWSPTVERKMIQTSPGAFDTRMLESIDAEATRNGIDHIFLRFVVTFPGDAAGGFGIDDQRVIDIRGRKVRMGNQYTTSYNCQPAVEAQVAFVRSVLEWIKARPSFARKIMGFSVVDNVYYEGEFGFDNYDESENAYPTLTDYSEWSRLGFIELMRVKYAGNLTAANAAWGTAFGQWSSVQLPRVAQDGSGPFWEWKGTYNRDFYYHRAVSLSNWLRQFALAGKAVGPNLIFGTENGSIHDILAVTTRGSALIAATTADFADLRKQNGHPDNDFDFSTRFSQQGGKLAAEEFFTAKDGQTQQYFTTAQMVRQIEGGFRSGCQFIVSAGFVPDTHPDWPGYLERVVQAYRQTRYLLSQPIPQEASAAPFSINMSTVLDRRHYFAPDSTGKTLQQEYKQAAGGQLLKINIVNDLN